MESTAIDRGLFGPSAATVWRLAWPVVALNSMQVVNTLLDRAFIGHLDRASLTGHGGAINILFLMFSIGFALATATTAIVSRGYGAQQRDEVVQGTDQGFSLSLYFSILIALLTWLSAPFAAALVLPAEDLEAQRQMTIFLRAYAFGLPAIFTITTVAAAMRGVGDTKSPMVISGIQIVLHILLNLFLILPGVQVGPIRLPGAGLGLLGAGIAMSASAWIAALVYVSYSRRTAIELRPSGRPPSWGWTVRLLRIAVPSGVMSVLRVLSLTAFTIALSMSGEGSVAIAAMGIAFAIESIMFMPAFGLSAAAGALVGQSLGMRNPERAETLAWIAGHHTALVTLMLCGPLFIFAPQITAALVPADAAVAAEAALLVRFLCATEFLFCYAMVMIGAMQGAGDTVRPLWLIIISLWLVRVPMAFWLTLPTGMDLGSSGAWFAMSFTQALQGILSMAMFRAGKWKHAQV